MSEASYAAARQEVMPQPHALQALTGNPFEAGLVLPSGRYGKQLRYTPAAADSHEPFNHLDDLQVGNTFFGQHLLAHLERPMAVHVRLISGNLPSPYDLMRQRATTLLQKTPHMAAVVNDYPLPVGLRQDLGRNTGSALEGLSQADDATLVAFANWNKDYAARQVQEKQPLLERMKDEFSVLLERAVQEQGLPLDLSMAQRKLDSLQLRLVDALELYTKDIGEEASDQVMHAAFIDRHNVVIIADEPDEAMLRYRTYHELLHGISGYEKFWVSTEEVKTSLEISRHGLAIHAYSPDEPNITPEARYIWLNEGVTEHALQILLSGDTAFSFAHSPTPALSNYRAGNYVPERIRMTHLLQISGVSFHSLLRAYFEDLVPGDPAPSKHVQNLYAELAQKLGEELTHKLKHMDDVTYSRLLRIHSQQ